MDATIYDKVQFLNQRQYEWHGVEVPHFFVQNAHEDLKPKTEKKKKVACFIGNVDRNKQVHKSIDRAFKDGHDEFRIYGRVHDPMYFNESVAPLVLSNKDKVKMMGFVMDRQSIYDEVTDVYLDSLSENASRVRDECTLTNVNFHGNDNAPFQELQTNEEILSIWKKELDLDV